MTVGYAKVYPAGAMAAIETALRRFRTSLEAQMADPRFREAFVDGRPGRVRVAITITEDTDGNQEQAQDHAHSARRESPDHPQAGRRHGGSALGDDFADLPEVGEDQRTPLLDVPR